MSSLSRISSRMQPGRYRPSVRPIARVKAPARTGRRNMGLASNLSAKELHDAHGERGPPVIAQDKFGDPEVACPGDPPHREAFPVRLRGTRRQDVMPTADALARLRIFEYRVLSINVVLGLKIVRIGGGPVVIHSRSDSPSSMSNLLDRRPPLVGRPTAHRLGKIHSGAMAKWPKEGPIVDVAKASAPILLSASSRPCRPSSAFGSSSEADIAVVDVVDREGRYLPFIRPGFEQRGRANRPPARLPRGRIGSPPRTRYASSPPLPANRGARHRARLFGLSIHEEWAAEVKADPGCKATQILGRTITQRHAAEREARRLDHARAAGGNQEAVDNACPASHP